MAILPVFFAVASAAAQGSYVIYEGKTSNLQVNENQGDRYEWKIFKDYRLSLEATNYDAVFTKGNQGSVVTVEWKKSGDYYILIKANSLTGCINMKVAKVKVLPLPLKALTGQPQIIGSCQTATLDGSKSIGDIVSYQWKTIDTGCTLSNPESKTTKFNMLTNYTGPLPADFRVILIVTDKKGNTDSDTVTVTVNKLPVADVYISGNLQKDGSMIVDGSVSSGIGIQYNWSTEEGKIIGDTQLASVTLNGAGNYKLEVTDIYGCKALKSFKFPLKSSIIIAKDDYERISWDQTVKIPVLDNDYDPDHNIDPQSLKIKENPSRGNVTVNKDGTITYSNNINKAGNDYFIYEVCDSLGSCDSAMVKIDIYDAGITVPEAFSPNEDGLNETLEFKGLDNYPQSQLYVYTRAGQLVYQSTDYHNDWTGKMIKNGKQLPIGTYYYILKLGGTNRSVKGFVFIKY